MKVTAIGVDLAKNLIQLHGADAHGKAVLKKQLKRNQALSFFANLPPCVIGMEACAGAHHWARTLESFGHQVKADGSAVREAVRQDEQERRG